MSKILCPYCDKEVSKNNIHVHQRTKSCREKQLITGVSLKKTYQQLEIELQATQSELQTRDSELETAKACLSDLNENNRELLVKVSVLKKEKLILESLTRKIITTRFSSN
jgi:hypothetical protein